MHGHGAAVVVDVVAALAVGEDLDAGLVRVPDAEGDLVDEGRAAGQRDAAAATAADCAARKREHRT